MLKLVRSSAITGLMLSATAALAGDLPPGVADNVMTSCRPDLHRVCAYVVPGDGRATRCLLDHETQLSPVCLKAVKLAYATDACMPDYERYCQGVPKGPQVTQCLSQRMGVLRPACRRIVAGNDPYVNPNGGRFSYNGGGYGGGGYNTGPAPYAGPAPYTGPAPYGQPYPPPYGYGDRYAYGDRYSGGERYQDEQAYSGEGQPRQLPYGAYPYGGGPQGEDRYAPNGQPGQQPYGAYPDRESPQDADRYADSGQERSQPYGESPQDADRSAGGGQPRFQPYGGRYPGPGSGYNDRGYGNGAPSEPEEESEPAR
jgi:hypothetical protein